MNASRKINGIAHRHGSSPDLPSTEKIDVSASIDRGGLLSSKDGEIISLSNMPSELGFNKKEKSLSFSGISVMIDTMIKSHSRAAASKNPRPEIEAAIVSENLSLLSKELMEDFRSGFRIAVISAVERNKPEVLNSLITLREEREEDSQDLPILRVKEIKDFDGKYLLFSAAYEGYVRICEILITRGECGPGVWNEDGSGTPMHAAVIRGNVKILELLHKAGNGDLHVGLENNSLMYYAISKNQSSVIRYLLNNKANDVGREKFTETGLHLCAENNHRECAELLLSEGAVLVDALRGEFVRETALHLAARNGYREMCSILLSYGADPNAPNSKKETPLHLSGKVLACGVMKLLIEKGADIEARDADGRPPLHCVINSEQRGATDCIQILIEHDVNLNAADHNGVTALHLAAVNAKTSRVNLLISHGADLCYKNNNGKPALHFAMKYTPSCIKAIQQRMDAGLKIENPESDLNCKIKMDFNTLIPSTNNFQSEVSLFTEILNIQSGIPHCTTAKILLHPLAEGFLHMKWNQIKWLYYIFILFSHFIYSLTYSVYAILVYKSLCSPLKNASISSLVSCDFTHNSRVQFALSAWIFLVIFTSIYVLKEITKFSHLKLRYFREYESLLNSLIIGTFLLISFHSNPFREKVYLYQWQYHASGFGVFMTWLLQMFLIGKVPRFGKYVEMFKTVSSTFLHFLIAYVFLFVAFVLSFYILFPTHAAFNGVLPAAFVKVLVMMLGELEYDELYYPVKEKIRMNRLSNDSQMWTGEINSDVETQIFPFTAHVFVTIFIVLVSIIIMNLLFGLAVADIQELYKTARLHQLIQQVELISYMESIMFSPLFNYLPDCSQKFLRKALQGIQGHYRYVKVVEPNNFQDQSLPKSLRKRLFKDLQDKYAESRSTSIEETNKNLNNIKHQLADLRNLILSMKNSSEYRRDSGYLVYEDELDFNSATPSILKSGYKRYRSNQPSMSESNNNKPEEYSKLRRISTHSASLLVEEEDFDSDCYEANSPRIRSSSDPIILPFPSPPLAKRRVSLAKINESTTTSSSNSLSSEQDTIKRNRKH